MNRHHAGRDCFSIQLGNKRQTFVSMSCDPAKVEHKVTEFRILAPPERRGLRPHLTLIRIDSSHPDLIVAKFRETHVALNRTIQDARKLERLVSALVQEREDFRSGDGTYFMTQR